MNAPLATHATNATTNVMRALPTKRRGSAASRGRNVVFVPRRHSAYETTVSITANAPQ